MQSNSKEARNWWLKLKILLFGVFGGMIGMIIVSLISLPGNYIDRILQGIISGSIISSGLVGAIVFSSGLIIKKSVAIKALVIIMCSTIGGIIGHLIYAAIISMSIIKLGAPMINILRGITSITFSGIILSFGISCGLVLARIISKNKVYVLRILIMATGGLFGNIIAESSFLLLYGNINTLRIIFGLLIGFFMAFAEKEEILI